MPGGSINKVMYRTKEKLPSKDGLSQRLRIAFLDRNDNENLAAFIKENCDTPQHDKPMQIATTGVGGTQYANELNELLNAK